MCGEMVDIDIKKRIDAFIGKDTHEKETGLNTLLDELSPYVLQNYTNSREVMQRAISQLDRINDVAIPFFVFVNIIDNAIYWLKQSDVPEKVIRLHADDTGIYISNNGIEIKPQDKERIFELRFSRKPNGRGLGLSVSKEVLNAENYDIFVVQPKEGSTVTFKIQKMQ